MKKVVVIGGGHGQVQILKGLKELDYVDLSAIVTVADNGGSTGRLRDSYNIPAMGDIRNVMVGLSESENMMSELMDYRFDGDKDIGGHSLGNLILTALTAITGDFMSAVERASDILNLDGTVIPATTEVVDIIALMDDGNEIYGEAQIPQYTCANIEKLYYERNVEATSSAIKAVKEADYIILGIGSLYTSIIPNIIIPEIKEELKKSKGKIIYICNAMSQKGETTGYSLEDHVKAIEEHSYKDIVDIVIASNEVTDKNVLKKYEDEHSYPVKIKEIDHNYSLIVEDLIDVENEYIRHNSEKIKIVLDKIMKEG